MLFSVLLLIHCVLANKLSKGRWNEKLFTTKIFLVSFYIAFSSVYYSLPEEKIFYTLRYSKGGDRRGKWCGTMPLLCATFVILGAVWFNYRSMRMMYASAFWMQTHCVLGKVSSSDHYLFRHLMNVFLAILTLEDPFIPAYASCHLSWFFLVCLLKTWPATLGPW